MLIPHLIRPLPTEMAATGAVALSGATCSVVRGPSGSYPAERLAATLMERDEWSTSVWLRGAKPGVDSLADALVEACAYRWAAGDPGVGPVEFSRGLSSDASSRLATMIGNAPDPTVIVVELGRPLTTSVGRLLARLCPVAAEHDVRLVVVAEGRSLVPARSGALAALPCTALWRTERREAPQWLSVAGWTRLQRFAQRRPALGDDILHAALAWPVEAVADALDGRAAGRPWRRRLDRLTRNLLEYCTAAQRSALELAVRTGYWHPQLAGGQVQAHELCPWMVPLEESWGWIRPVWLGPLRRSLARARRHPYRLARIPPPRVCQENIEPRGSCARRGDLAGDTPEATIQARLFGALEVRVDGTPVMLAGQRGQSVLRFLLTRPDHACPRDQLIEEFWPDVEVRAARNRLQVAVSGLRQGLRASLDAPVIEYCHGAYRIAPSIRVETDVERFEAATRAGGAAEIEGSLEAALARYREAAELYRDDFAADAPYESWTLLPREGLRIRYIDVLDRTSQLLVSVGRTDDCIATAHRMLDMDPCREDAHRLLMRCYLGQGRAHQAMRQYQLCCRALRATFGAAPAAETRALYAAIRSGRR